MENNGEGNNKYYSLKGIKDVDDICSLLDLNFFEGNILKSLVGIATARKTGKTRHNGTSIERDINKIEHYSRRAVKHMRESLTKDK